jgi:hypothetical protein
MSSRAQRERYFPSLIAPTPTSLIRRALLSIAAGMSLALAPSRALALQGARPQPADSNLRIVLLTVGQGDQVYELFGHNAIWIHDPSAGGDTVYNWGVFDFNTPGFLPRFLRGDMRYTMDAQTIGNTVAYYQYYRRRIWAQELDLTPAEKRALFDFIHWNYRPENRQYRYNYYLDNCSTRVRDVIDRVLGGRLRAYLKGISTQETYRSHSLRMMQGAPFLVTGVEVALGRPTDKPLNADQASFLPVQLMSYVKGFTLDGGKRPLVLREWMLNEPVGRAPEPTAVPSLWKWYLPIGLGIGAVILGLWFGLGARVATATIATLVAAAIGIVGTILVLLVTVTDHTAAHGNENLWMLNPIWLVVAVALPIALLKRRWKVARWATLAGAAVALGAVLMHLVGLSRQPNWDVIALLFPPQLAMAAVMWRYRGAARPVSEAGNA